MHIPAKRKTVKRTQIPKDKKESKARSVIIITLRHSVREVSESCSQSPPLAVAKLEVIGQFDEVSLQVRFHVQPILDLIAIT